ncbi:hypothetical protein Poli38472_005745 [Pythium oligandrum]|uniref:Calcyclin-binding protein n=1 Tax=Pythium oligandrum TaxID=41045 RepID=A0A8K1CT42_PYTOL|nr:hypothetical protein Poli38472_005745 [Pythium oligandrum]|eukprot:TMW68277.1 hypothetical protein Poli38472_005745 [Pythium oligandrum]
MAGDSNKQDLYEEIIELEMLLAQVKTAGNRRDLQQLRETKQKAWDALQAASVDVKVEPEPAAMEVEEPEIPKPAPVKVGVHPVKAADLGEELMVYTEISRFGWEDDGYGKDKVTVHIMSGIDGVGDLPKENVACKFTKDSFDLKIHHLNGKNYRLVKYHLDKDINPDKSSIRIKKNRIAITLWKADKNNTWMNLTAKNPNKKDRKSSADPAAGIMDMMKEMYDEGDEDMKRTIAKAWSESREKQAAGDAL